MPSSYCLDNTFLALIVSGLQLFKSKCKKTTHRLWKRENWIRLNITFANPTPMISPMYLPQSGYCFWVLVFLHLTAQTENKENFQQKTGFRGRPYRNYKANSTEPGPIKDSSENEYPEKGRSSDSFKPPRQFNKTNNYRNENVMVCFLIMSLFIRDNVIPWRYYYYCIRSVMVLICGRNVRLCVDELIFGYIGTWWCLAEIADIVPRFLLPATMPTLILDGLLKQLWWCQTVSC